METETTTYGGDLIIDTPDLKVSVENLPIPASRHRPLYHSRQAGVDAERARCVAILREMADAYGGNEGRLLRTAALRIEKR